jgi:hypothetical protein
METWTIMELREALWEVDEERKLLRRQARQLDQEMDWEQLEAMNEWAAKLWAEILRRAKST